MTRVSEAGVLVAVLILLSACGSVETSTGADTPSASSPAPSLPPASSSAASSPAAGLSVVTPPADPETGEVARFAFVRPGNNQVSVGPYAVAYDELVVRGACVSTAGTLTWKVIDNSVEAETAADVMVLDQGELVCDGSDQRATATVGTQREVSILGVTGSPSEEDGSESAWLTLANE